MSNYTLFLRDPKNRISVAANVELLTNDLTTLASVYQN
jgi:hypothetical protein